MCDCEMPVVYNDSKRKAKKLHVCCECDRQINKGDNYFSLQGLWNGQWENYKQCQSCHEIGEKYSECYPIGGLIQELINSDLIENQGEDDDAPKWVCCVDWLQIETHKPLRVRLNNEIHL